MNQKKKSIITASLTGIFVAILFISFQHLSCGKENGVPVFGASGASPLKGSDDSGRAWEVQKSFRKIYELYSDRVVFISTEQTVRIQPNPFFDDPFFREFFGVPNQQRQRTQKRTGLGSGFVLSEDGYICTNHHVVAGVDRVKVKISDRVYDAVVIGSDERTDVALLKINPSEKLHPVYLGDSDAVKVGDWAIAIGNPFGLDKTFTVGVISATARKDLDMMGGSQTHLQTDASINPGNSGGPLINIDGEVIGINRMIYSQSGGSMGIGFAVPVNNAKQVLEQLKKHKKLKRGYIGIQIVPFNVEYAKEIGLGTNEGALIGGLVEGGPASRSGLSVGDVVLKVNDRKIKGFDDLVSEVEKTPIDSTLKVEIWRNKSSMNFFVTVAERP